MQKSSLEIYIGNHLAAFSAAIVFNSLKNITANEIRYKKEDIIIINPEIFEDAIVSSNQPKSQ